jgi:enterobacterial common antigen flippase
MGGSSIVSILLGIVRTKVLALLMGPAGVGLAGLYTSTTSLVTAIFGMGIGESAVRSIAASAETGDRASVSRTASTVRRASLICGIAGLSFVLVFSPTLSRWTFGDAGHTWDLALLSLTVLFAAVAGGQLALIQGMRRIGDLAKINVLGALWSTVLSIPIIYVLHARGIAAFLLAASAAYLVTCWWYARALDVGRSRIRWRDFALDARPLARLGLAFMIASLMTMGTAYVLRVLVLHHLGMSATGIYQAATNLSSVYVAVILNAMFTDFYPRLTAAADDPQQFSALVNHQIEVGALLALPGILATITLAPVVITVFYSSEFLPSVTILRWQVMGVFLQVLSWPMGYMLRARSDRRLFLWTEAAANASHLGFAWLGIAWLGLSGVGVAFLAMNIMYWVLIYGVVRRHYGFAISARNVKLIAAAAAGIAVVFLSPVLFSRHPLLLALAASVLGGLLCFGALLRGSGLLQSRGLSFRSLFARHTAPGAVSVRGLTDSREEMPMPLFSVIIPTFNRAAFIGEAVESVLRQTYRDFELIVVDDGSTDHTREALAPYASRLRYLHQENQGVSSARNSGIHAATGRWIAFLDSDDRWAEGYLEAQARSITALPRAVAHVTNAVTLNEEGTRSNHFGETQLLDAFGARSHLVFDRPYGVILGHSHFFVQSMVIRRDVLLAAGLFKAHLTIAEDRDVIARVALCGPFSFCRDVWVEIVRRRESIDHLGAQRLTRGLYTARAFAEVYAGLLKLPGLTVRERLMTASSLSQMWRAMGNLLIMNGDKSQARKYFLKAFRLHPSAVSALKYGATLLPQRYSKVCVRRGKDVAPSW